MTIIRNLVQGPDWLEARLGDRVIKAEDGKPIAVHHHCAGIAAREYTGRSAGYDTANDIAAAVKGKLRHSEPPHGALLIWTDSDAGHIATRTSPGKVTCNVRVPGTSYSVIKEVPDSLYRNLDYKGWVYPWDIPGWGDKPLSQYKLEAEQNKPAPKPPVVSAKPTKGVTTIKRTTYVRNSPSKTGAKVRGPKGNWVVLRPGARKAYKNVIKRNGEVWLVTKAGNYFLAKRTSRGV